MTSRRSLSAVTILAIVVVLVAAFMLRARWHQRDQSNYVVDNQETRRAIELFEALGHKKDELSFGGSTSSKAVGHFGYGSAMQFGVKGQSRVMFGIHRLWGPGGDVIRFSAPRDESPFYVTVLSASLAEDQELRESFENMLQRMKISSPNNFRWIYEYVHDY